MQGIAVIEGKLGVKAIAHIFAVQGRSLTVLNQRSLMVGFFL